MEEAQNSYVIEHASVLECGYRVSHFREDAVLTEKVKYPASLEEVKERLTKLHKCYIDVAPLIVGHHFCEGGDGAGIHVLNIPCIDDNSLMQATRLERSPTSQ